MSGADSGPGRGRALWRRWTRRVGLVVVAIVVAIGTAIVMSALIDIATRLV